MSAVASVRDVTKRYGSVTALDEVTFAFEQDVVHGLLGRNGAGKTTLLRLLAGLDLPSAGEVRVHGAAPFEHDDVLAGVCLVSEAQTYPDSVRVRHVLQAARLLHRGWDEAYAQQLLRDFDLPLGRLMKKLSRGMLSAVGIVVGLASRAPLTLFDEPYLGLDAVSRQLFYDRLLADIGEHPRTVVLSTHLIDEVADLLERVVVVDAGRVLLDEDADVLRGRAVTVTGPASAVDRWVVGRDVLHDERLATHRRATVVGPVEAADRDAARTLGLQLDAVSLQQLVVRTATRHTDGTSQGEPSGIPAGALR